MNDFNALSAFFIGLLGSGHCLGMCGGITTMLTSAIDSHNQKRKISLALFYNIGRISTYALMGGVVAYSSSLMVRSIGLPIAYLQLVSAVFVILLGLYLGQWLMWLTRIERIGQRIWALIAPLSKKLLPVNSYKKSFLLGGLWGWLPCGLVYSTLTWSLAAGSAVEGAAIMACFGLGTLPAMLSLSVGITQLKKLIQKNIFKKTAAFLLIIYGIYTLTIASRPLF